jgi:hypothetical protein
MNTQAAISGYTEIKSQTLSHESIGYNVVSAALAKLEVSLKSLVSSTDTQERKKSVRNILTHLIFSAKEFRLQSPGRFSNQFVSSI